MQAQQVLDLAALIDGIEDTPQAARLQRVATAISTLERRASGARCPGRQAFAAAEAEIEAAKQDWETATADELAGYGEVLRELNEIGLEPGKYVATKAELTQLQTSKPRLAAQEQQIRTLLAQRDGLLDELRRHEIRRTEQLQSERVLPAAYATDDGADVLYRGTDFVEAVAENDTAGAYFVETVDDTVIEAPLDMRRL